MPAVGLLSVALHIPSSRSLKDKRVVLRSIKDRLRKLNISVSELDYHELHQRSALGVVAIGSSRDVVDRSLSAATSEIDKRAQHVILSMKIDWLM